MRVIAAALTALGLVAALAACQPSTNAVGQEDMSLGNPSAKVTVIEYASLGCPHCARWSNEVFPLFKAKYVDTGKARYVLREFLTGDPSVAAAGFLLARCAGKDKYFQVVDDVYHHLMDMEQPGARPRDVLQKIAESAGLSDQQFNACIDNDAALLALNKRVDAYARDQHIQATPTFVINGKTYDSGEMPIDQMDKAIALAEAQAK